MLLNAGIIGRAEFRKWYFGETEAQAHDAIEQIAKEQKDQMNAMNPDLPSLDDKGNGGGPLPEPDEKKPEDKAGGKATQPKGDDGK